MMEVIYRLSWLDDKSGMVPVNWREMQTEELGSVYESLLELQPQIANDGKSLVFANVASEKKGNQRKTTGSYYTPDSLVQALLNTALDPVLDKIEGESNDPAKAFLKLSVIDPACGSGHFLLAAARRIATRLAKTQTEGTPSLTEYRKALRDTTRHCIFGVDINPMAVELTKVALWIETVNPGHPLGYFDSQILCGDSLVGIFDPDAISNGIPDGAYKPLAGDDKSVALHYKVANQSAIKGQIDFEFGEKGKPLIPIKEMATKFSNLRSLPEDTLSQVEAKMQGIKELKAESDFINSNAAADLYVAAFLLPKTGEKPLQPSDRTIPTSEEVRRAGDGDDMHPAMVEAAKVARTARAFHWCLEFPDIIMGKMEDKGFDVVLGNPPWEVLKLNEVEYFSTKEPEIALLRGDKRKQKIVALKLSNPSAYAAFQTATHRMEASNAFIRSCGRFKLTGKGSMNSYALFAEHCANISRSHAGIIAPTGIATDLTTAPFFAEMVKTKRLAKLFDFENRTGLFPAVHRNTKFSLITLGRDEEATDFAFFLTDTAQIGEPERNLTLSSEEIASINPNTHTTPIFRSKADARLTAKIYRKIPVLCDESKGDKGNLWGVKFLRMLDMTSDSRLFRTAEELSGDNFTREGTGWIKNGQCYVPLYEAKMIDLFDHRSSGYELRGNMRGHSGLPPTTEEQHRDPNFDTTPWYWVPATECDSSLNRIDWKYNWIFGFRNVARSVDSRTFVGTVFPKAGVGHNMPLLLPMAGIDLRKKLALFASMESLIFDYLVRQKVGGINLTYTYVKQFPVLPPEYFNEKKLQFVTPHALELFYTSHSIKSFARDLGYGGLPFAWDRERRALLRADLDAFYARAYGLDREELRYILNPADVMGDTHPSETFRVLMNGENDKFGEYRTRRLILAAWDRMEAKGEFAAMGM
ncbi:MAG: N-6 DNA methylase [Gammaproteobacteria bacterium]|nr:N-6 DNA methylase [Gammaproteobacteria bacterium]